MGGEIIDASIDVFVQLIPDDTKKNLSCTPLAYLLTNHNEHPCQLHICGRHSLHGHAGLFCVWFSENLWLQAFLQALVRFHSCPITTMGMHATRSGASMASELVAYTLWLLFGFLGWHHIYLGRDDHAFLTSISLGGYLLSASLPSPQLPRYTSKPLVGFPSAPICFSGQGTLTP